MSSSDAHIGKIKINTVLNGRRYAVVSRPLLTVVVPVYNRAERVLATLRSMENQTLRPFNVILVDNNSTDETLSVLLDWKRKTEGDDTGIQVKVLEEAAPGAAAARNCGLQEVYTPYTMFFDSDDLMHPDHCRRALDGFMQNPSADIVGWDCITSTGRQLVFAGRDVYWANIHYGSMSTQRYAAKTGMFRKAGGWNPKCRGWEDIELGQRILALDPRIVKLKGSSTVTVILSADSVTGMNFSSKSDVWEATLDRMEVEAPGQDAKIKRYINIRRAILAGDYGREGQMTLSKALLAKVMDKEPSAVCRALCRFAYLYRKSGLRGTAQLLRPLVG